MKSFRCIHCGAKVVVINSRDIRRKFCNMSCAASFNNKKFPKRKRYKDAKCPNCGERTAHSRDTYCSSVCSGEYRRKEHIQKWIEDPATGTSPRGGLKPKIREYLLKQADYKCSECGWDKINPITNKSPLHVDHVDGDAFNNHPDNLKVLCPNCHSLTPTYGYIGARKGTRIRAQYTGKGHVAKTKETRKKHRSRPDGVGSRTDAGGSRP